MAMAFWAISGVTFRPPEVSIMLDCVKSFLKGSTVAFAPDSGYVVRYARLCFANAALTEHSDPLHGQKVKQLWPRGSRVDAPRRWVWHIVPQGAEKKYQDCGRVHIVEAWTRQAD